MILKRVLSGVCAALMTFLIPITAFAEDETLELDTEYTGYDEDPAIIFDEDLSYDYSLDIASVEVSFELVSFNEENALALKSLVIDQPSANDNYFLTLATNCWATVDSGYGVVENPIEPEGEGIYNLKFDVTAEGEMTNIKLELWQGTAKVYGVYYLNEDDEIIHSSGEIKTSTVGCYTPTEGKVDEFVLTEQQTTTEETTEETTEAETEIITVTTTESDDSSSSLKDVGIFDLLSAEIFGIRIIWILAVLFLIIGILFIVAGAMMSRKKHKKERAETDKKDKKNKKDKKDKAPRDIEKRDRE